MCEFMFMQHNTVFKNGGILDLYMSDIKLPVI